MDAETRDFLISQIPKSEWKVYFDADHLQWERLPCHRLWEDWRVEGERLYSGKNRLVQSGLSPGELEIVVDPASFDTGEIPSRGVQITAWMHPIAGTDMPSASGMRIEIAPDGNLKLFRSSDGSEVQTLQNHFDLSNPMTISLTVVSGRRIRPLFFKPPCFVRLKVNGVTVAEFEDEIYSGGFRLNGGVYRKIRFRPIPKEILDRLPF